MSSIAAPLSRLLAATYVRYLGASVVALAADGGSYLVALEAGVAPVVAAVLGYTIGIFVHWLLSSRLVFASGARDFAHRRNRQRSLFVGSALIGLALTGAVVAITTQLGLDPRLAKLVAIVVSFQATYFLRKMVVFR